METAHGDRCAASCSQGSAQHRRPRSTAEAPGVRNEPSRSHGDREGNTESSASATQNAVVDAAASVPASNKERGATTTNGKEEDGNSKQNKSMIVLRKQKPHVRTLLSVVVVLAVVTLTFVLLEYNPNADMPVQSETIKRRSAYPYAGDKHDRRTPSESDDITMDNEDLKDSEYRPYSFWDRHSHGRKKSVNPSAKKKTKKDRLAKTKRKNKGKVYEDRMRHGTHKDSSMPIPIIDFPDDPVPHAAMPVGTLLKAADALMCEATVIDYVINATDLKDECNGLIKAFESTCTEVTATQDDTAIDARQRQLHDDSTSMSQSPAQPPVSTNTVINRRNNPIQSTQRYLHRIWSRMQRFTAPKQNVFSVGDQIKEEWPNVRQDVERQNLDRIFRFRGDLNISRIKRGLTEVELEQSMKRAEKEQSMATNNDSTADAVSGGTPVSGSWINTTKVTNASSMSKTNANTNRPKTNLMLPVANGHLSQKAVEETLLLQNNKALASTMKSSTENNVAGEMAMEVEEKAATASAKAVSDTLDAVNTVLNDPTSIEARTCCASILTVYNENCGADDEEELSDRRLFIVVAVIALCGLVKSLIRYFDMKWLPEAAGCILVGVTSGWILMYFPHHDISFDGNWFLRIMVPPIVFEAAVSIDKRSFNRHIVPILFYAVVGTIFATAVTAAVVHKGSRYFHSYCETIPYIDSLTFGALISSIDPIAVLSVLSNMGMTDTDTIYVLIFGESLLNDGVAIVLFETLVHFLDDHLRVDTHAVVAATIHFFVVAVGSLSIGVASGYCATLYYWMMHGCQTPLVEVITFFCWALIPYYVCDGIDWSGIVAVVATGFVMDVNIIGQKFDHKLGGDDLSDDGTDKRPVRERRPVISKIGHLSAEAKTHVGFVTEILATTMETAIFAYLGLFLFSSRYHWNVHHTMLAVAGCCVSRAVMIPILSALANLVTRMQQDSDYCQSRNLPHHTSNLAPGRPAGVVIDKKMQLVLWFAGLRGAMSFALVENIPLYDANTGQGSRVKSELKAMTSVSIVFTVFILGGGTYYMMEGLGMAPNSGGRSPRRQSPRQDLSEMTSLMSEDSMEATETDDKKNEDSVFSTTCIEGGHNGSNGGRNTVTCRQRLAPVRDDAATG